MNIVIIGGGFAGVKAALELSRRKVGRIKLISDESYFLHHATLYATATGRNMAESVVPLSELFANHPLVTVVKDTLKSVDPDRKLAIGQKSHYKYDKLIIAIGSVTTYFGNKSIPKHAFGIRTLDEVKGFTEHIKTEVVEKNLDQQYYVIGAGPNGIELSSALHKYLQHLKTIHRLNRNKTKVVLVEATGRILPKASKTASKLISRRLNSLGIDLTHLGQKVTDVSGDSITIEGKTVSTKTVIWTAGLKNNPFFKAHLEYFSLDDRGYVQVDEYLMAHTNIYVLGDNNSVVYGGQALPALRQGIFIAKHLSRLKKKGGLRKFRPIKPPLAIPVGEGWGYVEWAGIYVSGRVGYMLRRAIELGGYLYLMPFKKALHTWRAHHILEVDE